MGLRVTGDQSLPVRFLLRTVIFSHAKAGTGNEGIRDSGGDQSHPVQPRQRQPYLGVECFG